MLGSKAFWAGLLERAVKTFAQSLLGALAVGTGLFHMDWLGALDVALGATALSVLTSLVTVTTVVSTSPTRTVTVQVNPVMPPTVPPQAGATPQS